MDTNSTENIDHLFREKLSDFRDKPSDKSVNRILDSIIDHSVPVSFWSGAVSFIASTKGLVAGLCVLVAFGAGSYFFYNQHDFGSFDQGKLSAVAGLGIESVGNEAVGGIKSISGNEVGASDIIGLGVEEFSHIGTGLSNEKIDSEHLLQNKNGLEQHTQNGMHLAKKKSWHTSPDKKGVYTADHEPVELSDRFFATDRLSNDNSVTIAGNSAVFDKYPTVRSVSGSENMVSFENHKGAANLTLNYVLSYKNAALEAELHSEVDLSEGAVVSVIGNGIVNKRQIRKAFAVGMRVNAEKMIEKSPFLQSNFTTSGELNATAYINNIQLQAGVAYSNLVSTFSESFDYEYDVRIEFDSVIGINPLTNEQIRVPGYKDEIVEDRYVGNATVHFSVASFPVSIGYTLKQKNICITPKIGAVFSSIFKEEKQLYSSPQSWRINQYASAEQQVVRSFISYTGAVEFAYALTGSAHFIAEPYIKYQSSMFRGDENDAFESEKIVGVKLGLNYMF